MAERDDNIEFHRRHIIPNLATSLKSGFKELRNDLKEGVQALLPFAALAADPLLAFGITAGQKAFSTIFGENSIFAGEKDERTREERESDKIKKSMDLSKQENTARELLIEKLQKRIDEIDDKHTTTGAITSDEMWEKIEARDKILDLQKDISDSNDNLTRILQPRLDTLESIISQQLDSGEEISKLQQLTGKKLEQAIAKLGRQNENLMSGSPPYLQTIANYIINSQPKLLEGLGAVLENQPTAKDFSNGISTLKDKDVVDLINISDEVKGLIPGEQNTEDAPDYFSNVQRPLLESIAKSFQGMLNLEIKRDRFSEEREREGKGDDGHLSLLQRLLGRGKEKKGNLLTNIFGDLGGLLGGFGGKFSIGGMLTGAIGKIFPKVAGMANPVSALALGLMWAVVDGLKGWAKSGEWGVSKIAGAIGAFLGGTADGGIKNAFMQSGKWALIGAGIGSVVPVVGTLIGGLIGSAIGGLLGWIGGENIAKAMDAVGSWFKNTWNNSVEFLKDSWIKFSGWISGVWEDVTNWFKGKWEQTKALPGQAAEAVKQGWNNTVDGVKEGWGIIGNKTSEMWEETKQGLSDTWDKSKEVARTGTGLIKDGFTWYGDQWVNIFSGVKNSITSMKDFVTEKFDQSINGVKNRWNDLLSKATDMWDGIRGWFTAIFEKIENFLSLENISLNPMNIPELLANLWTGIKTQLVKMIPDFAPGVKDMAIKALGLDRNDIEGSLGSGKNDGMNTYRSGSENKALARGPMTAGNIAQSTVVNNSTLNRNSNIYKPSSAFDPMTSQLSYGFQQ
tara:strand:- start:1954 stop:4332 length:2379 start_codon:yes stop_codon:yes gene_type:complete